MLCLEFWGLHLAPSSGRQPRHRVVTHIKVNNFIILPPFIFYLFRLFSEKMSHTDSVRIFTEKLSSVNFPI